MSLGQQSQLHRPTDGTQQFGTGKDVVSAFIHSINNPTTQYLHDPSVIDLRANQEAVERDFSAFCAGYLAGITATTKLQLMPQSPEESVRTVWNQYQQLQQQQQETESLGRMRQRA